MKKYINYILCSILFCCPFFVLAKVTCNSGDFSASLEIDKKELSINDKANITITSDFEYKVEYKLEEKNIVEINSDGLVTPIGVGKAQINTTISFIEEGETITNCTSTLDISVLSNDSSLKSLTLEEVDISKLFKSDGYEYEVNLPYSYEKINIIAVANDPNAQITGDGRRYINEGTNEYDVIVKATDGTTSTYKIKILREDANEDTSLKSLIVEGYVISPKFDSSIYEYTLNVDKDVEDINIKAEANYDNADVLGTGNYKLASGDNNFIITVTAENGNKQEYKLIVNKSNGNSKLTKLEIEDQKINFKSNKYIYNITINNKIEKLNIKTEVEENEKVEILGNENFRIGENEIIIRVSSKEKGSTTYKIIANKLSVEEQEIIEKNNILLNVLLVIFIISIIIMAVLIAIFLKRNYKKDKKKINNLKKKTNKK